MDPVSSTDRLVRLLRQKLEERAKSQSTRPGAATIPIARRQPPSARDSISSWARSGVQDDQLRRLLIEQLLVEQFGADVVNDAGFQQIVDRVTDMMRSDPVVGAMLETTLKRIKH